MTRYHRYSRRAAILTFGLVLASTVSSTAAAFKEHWHKAITHSALSFLRQPTLASMLKVHDQLDAPLHFWTAGVDHWHFNDCNFQGATQHINELYKDVLDSFAGPTPKNDWKTFGKLLHVAQDFYAHTNWIDLGQEALVDSKLDEWTVITPYSRLASDILAIEGRREGFRLERGAGERVVFVELPGGARMRGLISGAAYVKKHCPREVELGHWDTKAEHGGLAKDYPCRDPGFEKACSLALRQTMHEWCRLTELASKLPGGAAAIDAAIDPAQHDDALTLCAERKYLERFSGGCSCQAAE